MNDLIDDYNDDNDNNDGDGDGDGDDDDDDKVRQWFSGIAKMIIIDYNDDGDDKDWFSGRAITCVCRRPFDS